jgi:signal transduction histidine kinase
MGVAMDITARKQAETALREAQTTLEAIIESTDDLIWSVDPVSFGLMTFNRGLRNYFSEGRGICLKEGLRPEDLFPPGEYVDQWRRFYERALEDGPFTTEYLAYTGGKILQLSLSVLKRDGKVFGVAAFGKDITERKRVEQELRDFGARLISAQEAERARLARELHDDITQRLASIAIDVGRVEVDSSLASCRDETFRSVREELIRLSQDVHALSYRLHPSILEDLGLEAALRAEADHFERQGATGIDVRIQDVPESVSPDIALCVFRVAQEALRNAARHSGARLIKISLRGMDGGLQLAVQDDGCGFAHELHRDRPSLGLASMRERVYSLRGELSIESAPGQGTSVIAWVPPRRAEGQKRKPAKASE